MKRGGCREKNMKEGLKWMAQKFNYFVALM
jgi:hypothetical protein